MLPVAVNPEGTTVIVAVAFLVLSATEVAVTWKVAVLLGAV
jgi:hypothetical protein